MKKAFTMLELVFVMVVVGILSVMIAPNFQGNNLRQAADQVVSHIRYTQHLAMMDNKFDPNDSDWYKERWQIFFSTAASSQSYIIFSDINKDGNPSHSETGIKEVARNPLDSTKYLIGVNYGSFFGGKETEERISNNLNLKDEYSIKDISVTGGSTGSPARRVIFDSLGRPYRGNTDGGMSNIADKITSTTIFIKLCIETCTNPKNKKNNQNESVIAIEPETGYTHIL